MKPNIIIILTDDQGYGDLSCMGSEDVKTPNLDRLAENGVRFTDFYSGSPVCSPSRASLLTGRYPCNTGVRSILGGERSTKGITARTPTIASVLKEYDYKTAAIGKWHLGLAEESRPYNNGFDYFYGFMAGCIDYYSHIFYWGMGSGKNPVHDLWENGTEIYENGKYFSERVTEKSVEFIRNMSEEGKPFLLYTAYNAPHYPMHAPEKYIKRFMRLPPDRRIMAAMISAVDDGVGEMVNELERNGQLENTIIFFQSDNGPSRESRNWLDGTPDLYYGGSAGKLKGHKYSLFEGGIRVPAIFSWKSHIPNGQIINEPCAAMDIFPTVLEILGDKNNKYDVDGISIIDLLKIGQMKNTREIYWEMGEQTAIRSGNYKLVINGVLSGNKGEIDKIFLSDLKNDVSESVNLAEKLPDITNDLYEKTIEWRRKSNI